MLRNVFAPFCPLAFLLSLYQSGRWLVEAVGIENNDDWSLKDLRRAAENSRTNRIIGVSPSFSRSLSSNDVRFPPKALDRESASGPISRRGWQADGCLNELAYFQYVESIFTTAPER